MICIALEGEISSTQIEANSLTFLLLAQVNKRPDLESVIETIRKFPVWRKSPPAGYNQEIRDHAQKITVKIFSDNSWGSGIIIAKERDVYIVVTNAHVLQTQEDKYSLQTSDGVSHSAWQLKQKSFTDYDLALLQFKSSQFSYEVATLGHSSTLTEGEPVLAAGFPFSEEKREDLGLKITEGKISLISAKSLKDGYQIGYTNDIKKGMSGGPVLNLKGELIAINGIHAYPLWGDPYIYQDGEKPPASTLSLMEKLAWAIPIDTFLRLSPQFARYSS
jgi:S1-C subfamily serine protease